MISWQVLDGGGLGEVGDFFQEEKEGVEMDAKDDGKGEKGVFQCEPGEAGSGEGFPGGADVG